VEIEKLRGIGPKTSAWLHEIGVHTREDIAALGVVEVYRWLKARFPDRVTLNALYGLEAAMLGIAWTALPEPIKAELRAAAERD
jgi:hypothetical protein